MGLMLTSVTLVGGVIVHGISAGQDRIEGDLGALGKDFIAHTSNGHPASVVKIMEGHERQLQDLDDKLQREMRLINETTTSSVESLDRRIQNEITNLQNSLIERSVNNRDRIEKLYDRIDARRGSSP